LAALRRGFHTDEVEFPRLPRRICTLVGSRSVTSFGDESHHEERQHHKKRYPVLPEPAECPTLAYIYQITISSRTREDKQSIPWLGPPIVSMGVLGRYDLEDLSSSHILGSPQCGSLSSLEWDLRQLGLGKNTINSGQNSPRSQKSTHLQPMSWLSTVVMTAAGAGPTETQG
jgi:hypothetical protein